MSTTTIQKVFSGVCCTVWLLAWWCQAKGLNATAHRELLQKLQDPLYVASILPPTEDDGDPITVEVDLLINSVGPVNETDMTWTASFYLRREWTDLRLKLNNEGGTGGGPESDVVKLREDSMDSIWQPDIFFPNSKEGLRHHLTVPNRLINVYTGTGRVLSSQRLTMVLNCEMDLVKFPHDHQTCQIVMESYSYTTEDLVLRWSSKRDATDLHPTVYLPDFTIGSITTTNCSKTYAIGTYPCLQVTVQMHRQIGYYIIQTFLPTILIVILSWASFWIEHDAAPARVSVGLLTVLTITTELAGSTALLPRVPYTKAIDVWMSVNLVFVFAAYMEYPVVVVLSRRYRKADLRTRQQLTRQHDVNSAEPHSSLATITPTTPSLLRQNNHRSTTTQKRPRLSMLNVTATKTPPASVSKLARTPSSIFPPNMDSNDPGRQLDKKARVLFPLGFAIFNIVYWVYYMV